MKKNSSEQIKKVKSHIDILKAVSKDIPLEKHGKSYFGHCPFCDGSKSLSISQEKQFGHCFSCGESFDVIGYFQKAKDLTFAQAFKEVKCLINLENELSYKKLKRALFCVEDIIDNNYYDFVINDQPVLIDKDIKKELEKFLVILKDLISDYYILILNKIIDEQELTDFSQIFYLYGNFIENKTDRSAEVKYRNLFFFLLEICDLIKVNNYNLGGIVYFND